MKCLPQIAAFLLCLLVVSSASCPEAEDLYPCKCEEYDGRVVISCVGEGISQPDIKMALSKIGQEHVVELNLKDLKNLGKLKGDFFAGHHIRYLEITNCDIDALTDGKEPAFSGLEDSLQILEIASSLKDSPSLQFSHLKELKFLDLNNNQLLDLKDVGWPDSVNRLFLANNGIRSIVDHAFANLVGLISLDLDGNEINAFKRSWLPVPSDKLQYIYLDNNQLTSLPRDAFSNMPSLSNVYLQNNGIRSLEQEIWAGVYPQMRLLFLQGNPLVCDSNMEWIRQIKGGPFINGECQEPAELKGTNFLDWIFSGRRQSAKMEKFKVL